ncbi:FAD-binding domain-containing protein [Spirosoma aerolatum]|uniref:FAD-binding domain-containing protein n=1 Tax=Spirosoma aerolatum TaxID=1211326 RepID=UPI0009ABAB2F|nr:FAD-binding domain-containing protein [Spirosoma aerolatum]
MFTTVYREILDSIDQIDPIRYGQTRNYVDGAVTKLSPYVSRGVISTRQIAQRVLNKGFTPDQISPFLKELAWRDYFQQVWIAQIDAIDHDLKQPQENVEHHQIPSAILKANTTIEAIDTGIRDLYDTGYMHNHCRMYVASIACNIARSHWKNPAQWMYYYLLDADWASNALSWQWVAGSNSNKKYFANQENINRYCYTNQEKTFLSKRYEEFPLDNIPAELTTTESFALQTNLPITEPPVIDDTLPIYVYNFYNLDPAWDAHVKANRILLLEPSFFKKYPVCDKTISFLTDLSKNIDVIQIVVAEFDELFANRSTPIHYKEHPTTRHYKGIQHERDWLSPVVRGYFPSFFGYWKKLEGQLPMLLEV